jgi:hypothetical protein
MSEHEAVVATDDNSVESYISDLAGQLARMAESCGHPELAAVLEEAQLKAERLSEIQRSQPVLLS